MSTKMKIRGGVDVGNGYVKAVLRGADGTIDEIDMPSIASSVVGVPKKPIDVADGPAVVGADDFYNRLDVSFETPVVGDDLRHILGRQAVYTDTVDQQTFNHINGESKARQPLGRMLLLGVLAAKALRDYVRINNAMPEDRLDAVSTVVVALPIKEWYAEEQSYARELEGSHMVRIRNFSETVDVMVKIEHCAVLAEGASAVFAIRDRGEQMSQALLDDTRRMGQALEGITAADIYASRNILGIDIGEGTVNFPVYRDGEFDANNSRTLMNGYGSVLNMALQSLEGFSDLKSLEVFLQSTPDPTNRRKHAAITDTVLNYRKALARKIVSEFDEVLKYSGGSIGVVYVYGGGAGPMRDLLHSMLIERADISQPLGAPPILYPDTAFSRNLNREGMYSAAAKISARRKR